jgi:hypothetical protein
MRSLALVNSNALQLVEPGFSSKPILVIHLHFRGPALCSRPSILMRTSTSHALILQDNGLSGLGLGELITDSIESLQA